MGIAGAERGLGARLIGVPHHFATGRFGSPNRTRLRDWVLPLVNHVSELQNRLVKSINTKTVVMKPEMVTKLTSWMPQHFRFGSWSACFYCGTQPTDKDHVIPFSMCSSEIRKGASGDYPGPTTPSCHECNMLLASFYFDTLHDRCEYVNKRIRRKYSKFLHMETWQKWELDEIKGKLRGYVICKQAERNVAVDRASWQFKEEFTKLFEQAFDQAKSEHPDNKQFIEFMRPRWMEVAHSTAP